MQKLILANQCRIELKQSGKVLASNAQKFFSDGSSNTFHVHFDNPVQIEVSAQKVIACNTSHNAGAESTAASDTG